jgi:hypothetical protein
MNSTISKDKLKSKIHSPDAIPSFIRKTYEILEDRKFPEIIDWNPEGTAIVIKKPSEFCQKVLPCYFKHNNLTSFVRQLNMYNFHKRRTQNIDHVYHHELFQKGKRHLLKEIKRKNHEVSDKVLKGSETLESSQSGKDFSTLAYENQFLKRLYNEAMTKVGMLEGQVKDLSMQSQSLWSQICQKNECANAMKPLLARFGKQTSELTQDQLPMTFSVLSVPQLNLGLERQRSIQNSNTYTKSSVNVNHFFNLGQESDSTEVSHSSPSLQPSMESEKCFDFSDFTPFYSEASGQSNQTLKVSQFPFISLTPQMSQMQLSKPSNELAISRNEVSVGQMLEEWNFEPQSNEEMRFADQKSELQTQNLQPVCQDTSSVLGKRPFENEGNAGSMMCHFPEPSLKRSQDLSIFNRRFISTGTDDKENLRTYLRRDCSVNETYDSNVAVDLMDFNQAFYA